MNLVAHQLLSFNRPKWQVGNHLGDMVKGNKYQTYEPEIQQGILLHRFIDSFTDEHELVKKSSSRLHQNYGKYSPIIVDIFYDFLLIKHWDTFSETDFETFRKNCYRVLEAHKHLYDHKLGILTEAMIMYDWFMEYSTYEGIEKTLKALSQRTKFENNMYEAVKDLYMDEAAFEEDFLAFFPQLEEKCRAFVHI